MVKRLVDILCALLGLVALAPLILGAAVGVRIASPGPVLHRARRAGRHGRPFVMLKLRTMRVETTANARITASGDVRVFPFGEWLRRTKIDELPQLLNILAGEMSVIGPRPEDPYFVACAYLQAHRRTLDVRPGLASPGSLYHDSHGARFLRGDDPETAYVTRLLPIKLALDLIYVERASLWYDLRLVGRTLGQIARRLTGRAIGDPPELPAARALASRIARAERRGRSESVPTGGADARPLPRLATATVRALMLGWALLVLDACTSEPVAPHPSWLRDPEATILVGAGDIAVCDDPTDEMTAALLDGIPGTIFTAGDNAYPNGAYDDFVRCYEPGWGRHKARTRPAVGNHEYRTPGAADHFRYFGDRAGPAGLGYYSYELGDWHIVVLNSEIAMEAASAQGRWLADDLAASNSACVLAYWHRPLFSSGAEHGGSTRARDAWDLLYAAGAEVVLNGHEHIYERFGPQTPDGRADPEHGIRQFIVGTGGANKYAIGPPKPQSEVRSSGNAGVLALRLHPDGYEWRFVAVSGSAFADSGRGTCHAAPPPTTAPADGGT